MLVLADIFLTVLHLGIILFNLFGWISPVMRAAHRVCMGVTAAFWLSIGPLVGYPLGYCPVVDVQFRIKRMLGESNLPHSYIDYLLQQVGIHADPQIVDIMTGAVFALIAAVTCVLWWRERKRAAPVVAA